MQHRTLFDYLDNYFHIDIFFDQATFHPSHFREINIGQFNSKHIFLEFSPFEKTLFEVCQGSFKTD